MSWKPACIVVENVWFLWFTFVLIWQIIRLNDIRNNNISQLPYPAAHHKAVTVRGLPWIWLLDLDHFVVAISSGYFQRKFSVALCFINTTGRIVSGWVWVFRAKQQNCWTCGPNENQNVIQLRLDLKWSSIPGNGISKADTVSSTSESSPESTIERHQHEGHAVWSPEHWPLQY